MLVARANLQSHSANIVIARYSFTVARSCSDRVLKQGAEGNAGRANLQSHSTNVVIARYSFTVASSCSDRVLKQGDDRNAEVLFTDVGAQ